MSAHATANSNFNSALNQATFKAQTFSALLGGSAQGVGGQSGVGSFAALLAGHGTVGNSALFDPSAAFAMMSRINVSEVDFKAQFAELSAMRTELGAVRSEAASLLGGINSASDKTAVKSALQGFAADYNHWVQRFDADMQSGGILANTQAAQVSRFAMEKSVSDIFTGATDGLHGLRDLGLEIDPTTRLATVDTARLDAALTRNPSGVTAAVSELNAKFARAADLLNADGNFLRNRLGNLERVIGYIKTNKTSLQAEFGPGNAANPSTPVARALAAYNASQKI
jgi:hypothetical protein